MLFVLRDHSGAVKIPLNFTADSDGIGTGQIAEIAISTLGRLIVNAIATSPFRVTGTLTGGVEAFGNAVGDFLGIGGDDEEPPPEKPALAVEFLSGDAYLSRAGKEKIDGVIEELDDDEELILSIESRLGTGDVERLAIRANPSPEDCRDLADSLRRRKFEILTVRAEAAAEARASLAAGFRDRAEQTTRQLRGLDRDLALTEDALDRVLDMLRPGAERLGDRRTREAGVALMNIRAEEVVRYLLASKLDGIENRIRLKRVRFVDPPDPQGRVLLSLRRQVQKN